MRGKLPLQNMVLIELVEQRSASFRGVF